MTIIQRHQHELDGQQVHHQYGLFWHRRRRQRTRRVARRGPRRRAGSGRRHGRYKAQRSTAKKTPRGGGRAGQGSSLARCAAYTHARTPTRARAPTRRPYLDRRTISSNVSLRDRATGMRCKADVALWIVRQ